MITSPHNPKLKALKKLHDRRQRERTGLFLAEGEDMLAEALARGAYPEELYYDADALPAHHADLGAMPPGVTAIPVTGDVLAGASSLGSGTRIIGVWKQRWTSVGGPGGADAQVAVYLHEVADPGNVGAVIRSTLALASGIVVLSPATADPFGPKAIRGSMGAIFGQPVARAAFEELAARLGTTHRMIALLPRSGSPLHETDLGEAAVFCLGSERLGLPDSVVAGCDAVSHVPLRPGGAESLNVAMTATLCLYESALHRLSAERSPLSRLAPEPATSPTDASADPS
jgi:RNA methyltransferase, TrmH family